MRKRKRKTYSVAGYSALGEVVPIWRGSGDWLCIVQPNRLSIGKPIAYYADRYIPLSLLTMYPHALVCWVSPKQLIGHPTKPLKNRVCKAICAALVGG